MSAARAKRVTMRTNPERSLWTALGALERGLPLPPLTEMENLTLAVAKAEPTHALTLTSADMDQPEMARAFRLLVRRIERNAKTSKPLIYFGVYAQGKGDGGCHLHLLLWGYAPQAVWRKHAEAVGLYANRPKRIDSYQPHNVARAVGYTLSQNQSVFGSRKHLENQPKRKGQRRYITPQKRTLADHNPKLLSALNQAQTQS
jgi:hypothetical protein